MLLVTDAVSFHPDTHNTNSGTRLSGAWLPPHPKETLPWEYNILQQEVFLTSDSQSS